MDDLPVGGSAEAVTVGGEAVGWLLIGALATEVVIGTESFGLGVDVLRIGSGARRVFLK